MENSRVPRGHVVKIVLPDDLRLLLHERKIETGEGMGSIVERALREFFRKERG